MAGSSLAEISGNLRGRSEDRPSYYTLIPPCKRIRRHHPLLPNWWFLVDVRTVSRIDNSPVNYPIIDTDSIRFKKLLSTLYYYSSKTILHSRNSWSQSSYRSRLTRTRLKENLPPVRRRGGGTLWEDPSRSSACELFPPLIVLTILMIASVRCSTLGKLVCRTRITKHVEHG